MSKSVFSGKLGWIIPLLLAAGAVFLTWQYLRMQEQRLGLEAESVPVLVAVRDIPRMTKIDEDMVTLSRVPRRYLQPGAIAEIKDAVDQVSTAPILKGEQIVGSKLVSYGVETGLAIKVPRGKRAVTVPINDVTGVAGLIKPGNSVDVLVTYEFGDGERSDLRTYTLLQDTIVLAVGQNLRADVDVEQLRDGNDGAGRMRGMSKNNVTLALTPMDAQKVVLSLGAGEVTLVLRSMFEEHRTERLPKANVQTTLDEQEKIMYRSRPKWGEIRGTESRR